jgi:hypothetical protein
MPAAASGGGLFVVRPHAQHTNRFLSFKDFVDKPVLDVDAAGKGSSHVADELFEWGWPLKRIDPQDFQQCPGLRLQSGLGQFFGVVQRMTGKRQ